MKRDEWCGVPEHGAGESGHAEACKGGAEALADGRLEPALEEWSERFSWSLRRYAERQHLPPPRASIDFLEPAAKQGTARTWQPGATAREMASTGTPRAIRNSSPNPYILDCS